LIGSVLEPWFVTAICFVGLVLPSTVTGKFNLGAEVLTNVWAAILATKPLSLFGEGSYAG
jgi:hypothetical protein